MQREGWSDVPYGRPALIDARRTIECTEGHDCQCRASNQTPATESHR